MIIKQSVSITKEEALKILSKVIENKTKKTVVKADFDTLNFTLQDATLESEQPASTDTKPAVK